MSLFAKVYFYAITTIQHCHVHPLPPPPTKNNTSATVTTIILQATAIADATNITKTTIIAQCSLSRLLNIKGTSNYKCQDNSVASQSQLLKKPTVIAAIATDASNISCLMTSPFIFSPIFFHQDNFQKLLISTKIIWLDIEYKLNLINRFSNINVVNFVVSRKLSSYWWRWL